MLDFIARECGGPGGGTPVLVAHKGKTFDFVLLRTAFKRVGMELPPECIFIDTYIFVGVRMVIPLALCQSCVSLLTLAVTNRTVVCHSGM